MPIDDTTNYWIARGQQMFGPYTGSQVRDYVASGNIVASDLIRGERDSDWQPISVALNIPMPPMAPPHPGLSTQGGWAGAGYGMPPNAGGAMPADSGRTLALWSIGVGLFGFLCCSCASPVGLILGVIALVKVRPESKNLAWAGLIIGIISLLANVGVAILFAMRPELNPLNDLLKNLPQP